MFEEQEAEEAEVDNSIYIFRKKKNNFKLKYKISK